MWWLVAAMDSRRAVGREERCTGGEVKSLCLHSGDGTILSQCHHLYLVLTGWCPTLIYCTVMAILIYVDSEARVQLNTKVISVCTRVQYLRLTCDAIIIKG